MVSNCDEFKNSNSNQYTMKLSIPLTNKIVSLTTSTSTNTQRQILSCNDENKDIYKYIAIISSSIDGLLIIALLVYILKSRNNDINYFIKVKKIMSNYRSFIQKINNDFDCLDFQQLHVNSFEEMLEIRDTILKPILMYENEDKTASRFYIPADNNLVYVFEIKVEPKIIETLEQLNEELNTSTLRKYKYSSKRRSFK